MSGNPYVSGLPYGSGTYPTGATNASGATAAWAGQNVAVQPAANWWTPSKPLPAEEANYELQKLGNAVLYIDAAQGKQVSTVTGATGPYKCIEELVLFTTGTSGAGSPGGKITDVSSWRTNTSLVTSAAITKLSAAVSTQVGDIMEIELVGALGYTMGATASTQVAADLAIGYATSGASGATSATLQTTEYYRGGTVSAISLNTGTSWSAPISLKARYTVVSGATGAFGAQVNGCALTDGSLSSFGLYDGWTMTLKHYTPY